MGNSFPRKLDHATRAIILKLLYGKVLYPSGKGWLESIWFFVLQLRSYIWDGVTALVLSF